MSHGRERVIVTGCGVVSPFGRGVEVFWEALAQGRRALAEVDALRAAGMQPAVCAEVPGAWSDPDRGGAFVLCAAEDALAEAGLAPTSVDPARVGVAIGTTLGGILIFERWIAAGLGEPARCDDDVAERIPYFAAAARLADHVGAAGPVLTTQLACASGTAAVATGAQWIASGRCDVVLAGGTDPLCRYVVAGFNCLRATSEDARPFDADRQGLVLGEGAGVVVLEAETHARRRGAAVQARVLGSGAAGDAVHMTAPDREGRGAASAMAQALGRADVRAADVGFVSAHGTGTRYNDAMEARAIGSVFGTRAVPVNSIKGAIGHTLGAAGALEAIACVEVLRRGLLPPTAGLERVADDCRDLDVVLGAPRSVAVETCVSTSSGFAGANAALVLGRA